jgi:hypothetical protein
VSTFVVDRVAGRDQSRRRDVWDCAPDRRAKQSRACTIPACSPATVTVAAPAATIATISTCAVSGPIGPASGDVLGSAVPPAYPPGLMPLRWGLHAEGSANAATTYPACALPGILRGC